MCMTTTTESRNVNEVRGTVPYRTTRGRFVALDAPVASVMADEATDAEFLRAILGPDDFRALAPAFFPVTATVALRFVEHKRFEDTWDRLHW